MILAIHSSPNPGGNLERMLIRAVENSGLDYELVRLAELNMNPCLGCARCAGNNKCIHQDDLAAVFEKFPRASGLIMGAVNYNGMMNSMTHIFLERLFVHYHQNSVLRGMPAGVVAVGGEEPEKAAGNVISYLKNIYFFKVIGAALFKSDIPPCFSCGYGTKCPAGMPALHWPKERFKNFTRVRKNMFLRYEDNADAVLACKRLGQALFQAVTGQQGRRPKSGAGFYLP
jgi:multimeric flavodoxin WrbA